MTVEELIAKLEEFELDADVYICANTGSCELTSVSEWDGRVELS